MQFPDQVKVTDQIIDVSDLSDTQKDYYLSLATSVKDRYVSQECGRQIVTLSGPPGAGKSVVGAILEAMFQMDGIFRFVNIGLDAFHYPNHHLKALDRLDWKGRYDTYDVDALLTKLKAFKRRQVVTFPVYSRIEHNPVPDQIRITEQNCCLFLEGQWLLRDTPKWAAVRELSAFNYLVSGSVADMKAGVVKRHITGGRTADDAETFYRSSDLRNTHAVLSGSAAPDATLRFYKDI